MSRYIDCNKVSDIYEIASGHTTVNPWRGSFIPNKIKNICETLRRLLEEYNICYTRYDTQELINYFKTIWMDDLDLITNDEDLVCWYISDVNDRLRFYNDNNHKQDRKIKLNFVLNEMKSLQSTILKYRDRLCKALTQLDLNITRIRSIRDELSYLIENLYDNILSDIDYADLVILESTLAKFNEEINNIHDFVYETELANGVYFSTHYSDRLMFLYGMINN